MNDIETIIKQNKNKIDCIIDQYDVRGVIYVITSITRITTAENILKQ